MTNVQIPMTKTGRKRNLAAFGILGFEFVSDFDIRISDLFGIWCLGFGIFYRGLACRWGRLILARSVRWVRLPSGPLNERLRKVAGYGWPGRFAKPCDSTRVVWVRIPCLPLEVVKCQRLDGETDDHSLVLTRSSGFESWSSC
jgi:hypothetical protein